MQMGPDGKPYWQCTCGVVWDTFSTAARCPGCGKVWEYTQCIASAGGCNANSPRLDWYDGPDETIRQLKEEVKENWLLPI